MKACTKAVAALLIVAGALSIVELAPAVAGPAVEPAAQDASSKRKNVGPPLADAGATRPPAAAPAAPGLQVVAGTVAPETGVRFDSSGQVHYFGSDAAAMTTERHGETVVTTVVPRH